MSQEKREREEVPTQSLEQPSSFTHPATPRPHWGLMSSAVSLDTVEDIGTNFRWKINEQNSK